MSRPNNTRWWPRRPQARRGAVALLAVAFLALTLGVAAAQAPKFLGVSPAADEGHTEEGPERADAADEETGEEPSPDRQETTEGDPDPEPDGRGRGSEKSEEAGGAGERPAEKEKAEESSDEKPEQDGRAARERDTQKDSRSGAGTRESARQVSPPPPSDPTMSLTIPRLELYGDTVRNDDSGWALDQGAIKLPPTGFPWQDGANTYVTGHRIGYAGTESRYQFYNLPAIQDGDAVYLTDANGATYEYRVTEKFAVEPTESWVTEPVAGKDMVSLQTCVDSLEPSTWWDITPRLMRAGPDSGRLIVRAEKVATYPA